MKGFCKWLIKMWTKYKSIILYCIFGGLTTLTDFIVYLTCTRIFHLDEQIATWSAWFFAVLFAFFTNRKWVFNADKTSKRGFLYQLVSFFGSRVASGLLNSAMIFIFFTKLGINDIVVKIFTSVIVVILNYILSKLIVFRKKKTED
ncbi:MAG TPA: GtrA family protein [Oscillospiraceae bacterium]|nr:GtrA family protein [Oscillospiraceae bacterium]